MRIVVPNCQTDATTAHVSAATARASCSGTRVGGIPSAIAILLQFSLPIASGVLLGIAFLEPPLNVLAWVALVPLVAIIAVGRQIVMVCLAAYLGGVVFHLLALDWMRTRYDAIGLAGSQRMDWFLFGVVFGTAWLPLTLLVRRLVTRTRLPLAIIVPLCFVVAEFLRTWLGVVCSQTLFPWAQLGLTQAPHLRLIQVADIGGVWAVTALVALVNGALADMILFGRWRSSLIAGLVVGATWGYGDFRMRQTNTQPGPTVAVVPPSLQPSADLRSSDADLLIWSEGGLARTLGGQDPRVLPSLCDCAAATEAVLVVGCNRTSKGRMYNSAAVIDPSHGYLGHYDKCNLVPWKEFAPWTNDSTQSRFAWGDVRRTFSAQGHTFAPTICYDACFDSFYTQYDPKPDFFVVSSCETSDGTGFLSRGLLDITRFRAIENRRAFVRSVEGGQSGIIDSTGRLLASPVERDQSPTIMGSMPIDHRTTWYSMWGNWPVVGAAFVAVALLFGTYRKTESDRSRTIYEHSPTPGCPATMRRAKMESGV